MEDGGFFGFDTSLPPVRRGPQQEFGDVELEDTYDALNDETFGIETAEEDWEEEHEKLTEFLGEIPKSSVDVPKSSNDYIMDDEEECAYPGPQPKSLRSAHIDRSGNVEFEIDSDAANVAASISQIILDDDDIESIISRPINYSRSIGSKLYGRMSPPTSLFDSDMVGSPSTPSIWSTQPSDMRHPPKEAPRKVEPTVSNGNLPAAGHNLLQNGLFKTVADLERDLMKQPNKPLTLEELERSIMTNKVALLTNSIRSVEEIEAELTGNLNQKPMGMVPQQHPHLRPPFMRPPVGLPPPLGMPMPMPLPMLPNVMAGMPGMPQMSMAMPPHMGQLPPGFSPPNANNNSPLRPHESPRPRREEQQQQQQRKATNSSRDDYDEYAGLMSTKEKQWLMSIQINQLISDNPYVDDYYFTVLRLRCLGKLHQGKEGDKDGPKLILPAERAKIEAKTYAPAQFANSLGKLQVVTYTAPRRIIDVSITQASPESAHHDPQVAVKDLRKFKQILLDIESMYGWLLDLEDAEMRVESLPTDAVPGPHHQAAVEIQNKLQTFLAPGDRLLQVLFVRKGKMLILRAWPRLTPQLQEMVVKTMLLNCLSLIRRDAHDHVLVRFLPLVNEYVASLTELEGLVTMAQLMENAQRNSGFVSITSTKMGLDLISLMMCRGSEIFPRCKDQAATSRWSSFVQSVGNALLDTPVLQSDLGLLTLEPFEQTETDEKKLTGLKSALDRLVSSI